MADLIAACVSLIGSWIYVLMELPSKFARSAIALSCGLWTVILVCFVGTA